MRVPCYSCDTVTDLEVGFEVVNFVCPNCRNLYLADSEGQLRLKSKFKNSTDSFALKVGDKGILKGTEYTVTGFLLKNVYGGYKWTEYILQSKEKDFVYLSESDGNWIFLTELEEKFEVKNHPNTVEYNDDTFDLYEYCDAEILTAQGFFDFELPNTWIHMVEYIQPPFMISVERINKVETAFLGEYISKSEIKKAFPAAELPYQTGVNITQPYYFDLKNTAIIFCLFALLIITANWYIYREQAEKSVFYKEVTFDEFNNKEITSDSFELVGGSAPLSISVATDVDNSWANVDVALVDEKTNDEIHANKDIEYYHGYTDGENWTEGNQSSNFNICGVKQGKYHLLITPMKAPEDLTNKSMKIKVVWNEPSNRNVWFVVIFMIVVFIIIRLLKINFEKNRWADSSYSPYSEE